jgi:hypothetical protein
MVVLGFTALFVALVVTGCKPKAAAVPTPAADLPVVASTDAAPVVVAPPVDSNLPQVKVSPDGVPDLHEFNRYLRRWIVSHRQRPANFEEFAASAGVQIPTPPAGKKYELDKGMHIVLVDQ